MSRLGTHRDLRQQMDLTDRQREVIELMARGHTNAEIGGRLGITLDGAKWHVSEIMSKFGASSREEAVALWREYTSPSAKVSRAMRGVAAIGLLRWGAAAVATLAVGAGAAFAYVTLADDNGDEDDDTVAVVTPTAASEPTRVAETPGCVRGAASFSLETEQGDGDSVVFIAYGSADPPCHFVGDGRLSLGEVAGGTAAPAEAIAPINTELGPEPVPVARFTWRDWCGTPVATFLARWLIDGDPEEFFLEEAPPCVSGGPAAVHLVYDGLPAGAPAPADPQVPGDIDGVPVEALVLGEETPLPGGLAIAYSYGCYECGGLPNPNRVYIGDDDSLVRERLRERVTAAADEDGVVFASVVSHDMRTWFAAVCLQGTCASPDWPSEDAEFAMLRSLDGGTTWDVLDVRSGGVFAWGVVGDQAMVQWSSSAGAEDGHVLFPSGEVLEPPAIDGARLFPRYWPGHGIVWWQEAYGPDEPRGRFFDGDGDLILDVPRRTAFGVDGRFYATWTDPHHSHRYLGVYEDGGAPVAFFRWDHRVAGRIDLRVSGAITPSLLLGNALLPHPEDPDRPHRLLPVLIDLESATVRVIAGLSDGIASHEFINLDGAVAREPYPWSVES